MVFSFAVFTVKLNSLVIELFPRCGGLDMGMPYPRRSVCHSGLKNLWSQFTLWPLEEWSVREKHLMVICVGKQILELLLLFERINFHMCNRLSCGRVAMPFLPCHSRRQGQKRAMLFRGSSNEEKLVSAVWNEKEVLGCINCLSLEGKADSRL